MNSNTRSTILASAGVLILIAIGVWWYFGFSLDFMRFFAAEPGADADPQDGSVSQLCLAPDGCSCVGTNVVCPRVACVAESETISAGSSTIVHAYGAEDESYQFFVPGGTMAMESGADGGEGTTALVGYSTVGKKQVLVVGPRAGAPDVIDVATCPITVASGIVNPAR